MKLNEAIRTQKSLNNEEGVALNILYTSYMVRCKTVSVLKDYALSPEQYNILRILKGSLPNIVNIKQIAERLVERSANVPRTIDKLVAKKLVKRKNCPTDKRETHIEISTAGIKLLEAATPVLLEVLQQLCNLNHSEIKNLNILLDKYRSE